jgi:predicted DNA-binding transcriptional regulator YafY
MPSSKLAFFRFMLIDQLLRNKFKKYPSKEEILAACNEKFGVSSLSTIEKDLNAMRLEFDAPILYNKKQKGYEYSDKNYKFMAVNLSEDNLVALSFVETILKDFKDMPIFAEFSDAVDKVLDGVEITRTLKNNPLKSFHQCVQIDKMPYFKGSALLSDLIRWVSNNKVVQLSYRKFNADSNKVYTVHPYLLKEYRNMWYLLGYVADYQEVRTFGIDRIEGVEVIDSPFLSPQTVDFDADSFYKYCIGVTMLSAVPERILLHFMPQAANYIKAQPIHHTQQIIKSDEETGCIVALNLVINFELKREILSYGSQVKVIEPAQLADEIQTDLANAAHSYFYG